MVHYGLYSELCVFFPFLQMAQACWEVYCLLGFMGLYHLLVCWFLFKEKCWHIIIRLMLLLSLMSVTKTVLVFTFLSGDVFTLCLWTAVSETGLLHYFMGVWPWPSWRHFQGQIIVKIRCAFILISGAQNCYTTLGVWPWPSGRWLQGQINIKRYSIVILLLLFHFKKELLPFLKEMLVCGYPIHKFSSLVVDRLVSVCHHLKKK